MAMTSVTTMTELMKELQVCERQGKLSFIFASANWCTPCKHIKPSFNALMKRWSDYGVAIGVINFNIDEAAQLGEYFNVSKLPYFICLLPFPHMTLTIKELRLESATSSDLDRWVQNIMQKWLTQTHSWNSNKNAS